MINDQRIGPPSSPLLTTRCDVESTDDRNWMLRMELEVAGERSVWRLAVRGELDLLSAPLLGLAIDALVAWPGSTVIVDLADVSFIDAAGLHAIMSTGGQPTKPRDRVSLGEVSPVVRRFLQLAGLDERLRRGPAPPPSPRGRVLDGDACASSVTPSSTTDGCGTP